MTIVMISPDLWMEHFVVSVTTIAVDTDTDGTLHLLEKPGRFAAIAFVQGGNLAEERFWGFEGDGGVGLGFGTPITGIIPVARDTNSFGARSALVTVWLKK